MQLCNRDGALHGVSPISLPLLQSHLDGQRPPGSVISENQIMFYTRTKLVKLDLARESELSAKRSV